MATFFKLLTCEWIKLRRSHAVKFVLFLLLLFFFVDFWFWGRLNLNLAHLDEKNKAILAQMPIKAVLALWSGFFHPLLIAVLPALILWPEHLNNMWKHLHAQPVSKRTQYFSKMASLLFGVSAVLLFLMLGLWMEWAFIKSINPKIAFPFPWKILFSVCSWIWMGSLPLLGLYLWFSDRVNHSAIPIMFALIGLILTISMSGQELDPLWKRDLIPWVLPYQSAQLAIAQVEARQETHIAGKPFEKVYGPIKIRKSKYGLKVIPPDDPLLPPRPTPKWLIAAFSLTIWSLFLVLGCLDSTRDR